MPRHFSDAFHYGKQWLTSTTGAPLRAAYDFLFPPLDDLYLQDTTTPDTMQWRANLSPRTAYDRNMGHQASSSASASASFHPDESIDRLDVWDSFSDSPWSFVTSRYTIALIIVAVINNRVQHICRPRGGATARLSQLQRIALRLPSLVLMARSVLIFTTVVADAFLSESNPFNALLRSCTTTSWRNAWLGHVPMSGWALDRFGSSSRDALLRARDASALWAAFTSTCVAVISDAIVRNLDADREEPPAFNLVGFAFLLHFHSFSPDAPANEHVYLCVLLQLLQILAIALSRCRRPVYARRLVISSFFGIASLLHYALAARSGRYPFLEALSRTPEIALVLVVLLTVTLHALTMLLLEGGIQPHRLLFSRSNLPSLDEDWSLALFKLGTACMESTRLTGLEREAEPLVVWEAPYIELSQSGRIELVDPLLSRSSALRHPHSSSLSSSPPPHQGASFGGSGGLSREIKEIRIEPNAQSRSSSSTFGHAGIARVRAILQFGVVTLLVLRTLAMRAFRKLLRTVGLPDPSVPQWVYKALAVVRLVWHGRNGEARRRERQAAEERSRRERREQQQRYRLQYGATPVAAESSSLSSRQAAAAGGAVSVGSWLDFPQWSNSALAASAIGVDEAEARAERGRSALSAQLGRSNALSGRGFGDDRATEDEEESDEGDGEYNVGRTEQEMQYDSDDDERAGESTDELDEVEVEPDEVSGLFEELGSFSDGDAASSDRTSTQLTLHTGTEAFNQLLLAHLTRSATQPLTRSGYTSLLHSTSTALPSSLPLAPSDADARLAESLLDRRTTRAARNPSDDARRLCVVCCTEERNVICWPCRCLSLCMDCREHLASRPPPRRQDSAQTPRSDATHLCPTCRTPVQAFSRLYIP